MKDKQAMMLKSLTRHTRLPVSSANYLQKDSMLSILITLSPYLSKAHGL